MTLLDVTNPLKPKKLVGGYGDFTNNGKNQTHANQVHSAFGWTKTETGRTYVIMTDDEELTDSDIIDITNPSKPTWVAEYDIRAQSSQPLGAVHGDAVFIHDEVVKKVGNQYIGLLSYWDGGYTQVDLTDPAKPRTSGTPTARPSTPFCRLRRVPSCHPRTTPTRPSSRETTDTSWPPMRTSVRTASLSSSVMDRSPATTPPPSRALTCPRSTTTGRCPATPGSWGWRAMRRRSRRLTPHTPSPSSNGASATSRRRSSRSKPPATRAPLSSTAPAWTDARR